MADVHSNLEALEAVLEDFEEKGEIWCLGDVVGYGPNPNECIATLNHRGLQHGTTEKSTESQRLVRYCVAGNHDLGVLGKLELDWFNAFAVEAIEITRKIIEKKHRNFLVSLPKFLKLGEAILVHGSPRDPIFEYLSETHQAELNFEAFQEKICFCGHSHYPVVFEKDDDVVRKIVPYFQKKIKLKKGCRYLINPGSVGQPRDGDNRASYGVFDDQKLTFEFRRVPYPIGKTQEKMRKLGLPGFLIQRLALGR